MKVNYKKILITLGAFAATLLIRFPFNLKKETNIDKMINVLTRYNYNCINNVCSKTVKDYGCTGTTTTDFNSFTNKSDLSCPLNNVIITTTYNWKTNTLSQYTKSDT